MRLQAFSSLTTCELHLCPCRAARRYSCTVASGQPLHSVATLLPGPAAGESIDDSGRHWRSSPSVEPLTWSEVAIGMMVGLRGIGDAPPIPGQPTRGRAELEARLLQLGQQTWMPQVPGLALAVRGSALLR